MGYCFRRKAYTEALNSLQFMELRRATSTLSGRRRHPWLKGLGWLLVAALSCFIIAVAAGVVQDKIHHPRIWPG